MNYLKIILAFLGIATITNAAQIVAINSKADFVSSKVKVTETEEKALNIDGNGIICSNKLFTVDPNKQYKISLEYKFSSPASKENLRFGFMQYDKKKVMIHPAQVLTNKGSETTLTKELKFNDKIIYVKDASKWKGNSASHIALRVDASGKSRDLPNRALVPARIKKIEQKDGQYLIHLYSSARVNYPANTAIREHFSGWYGLGLLKLTPSTTWKKASFTTTKGTTTLNSNMQWNKHAKYASFFLMANCKNIQIKSIVIEEITPKTNKK
jgi:hypothetical protein